MIRYLTLTAISALSLWACTATENQSAAPDIGADKAATDIAAPTSQTERVQLSDIISNQPEDVKQRYAARRPQETLEFFGLKPDMTVIEVLPGGGWYSRIISPYLGVDGQLIGADYSLPMWSEFGGFATPEFIKARQGWADKWQQDISAKLPAGSSGISAYTLATLPRELNGTVDMALLIRAMHNLARFNDKGAYLDKALSALHKTLKPGGIVGIVQHAAPPESDDKWADGNNGYLKEAYIIAAMEKAGFELAGRSDLNLNPRDIPSSTDNVWRLPPTLGTSKTDEELRARMEAIGESSRMTLKFIKPE